MNQTTDSTKESHLTVTGMTCGNCVRHVKEALDALPGIKGVDVDLNANSVTVRHDPELASVAAIAQAIEDEGYGAKEA